MNYIKYFSSNNINQQYYQQIKLKFYEETTFFISNDFH